jgi:hypothetical protein
VDGRILENVFRHLVGGNSITLASPEIPSLPTFAPGTHMVRFIILNPIQNIPRPEAIYFVTAEEFKPLRKIELVLPLDNSELGYSPAQFNWEKENETSVYLIEFLEKEGEKPIFSAYVKKGSYVIPGEVFTSVFSVNNMYKWRVKGFDTESNIVAESPMYEFSFR